MQQIGLLFDRLCGWRGDSWNRWIEGKEGCDKIGRDEILYAYTTNNGNNTKGDGDDDDNNDNDDAYYMI